MSMVRSCLDGKGQKKKSKNRLWRKKNSWPNNNCLRRQEITKERKGKD